MSILNNSLLLGADAGAGGYQVARSLRFNASDSAYLSRTPASAGNRKTWTFSLWVKRSAIGTNNELFTAGTDVVNGPGAQIALRTGSDIRWTSYSGAFQLQLITTQVFRDPSAWYHLLFSVDTTQATAANRARIFVNGSQVTTFSTETYPSQNTDLLWNQAALQGIATNVTAAGSSYFDGYLADIHFIDGQALTPSSFAETNATTGQWVPKAYSGSYGTNGFQLKFADNSNNTATTLGKDTSGNGNNWTPNNLSVTAGAGNDSLVDTPTSYGTDTGAGGEVRGNYCTINPLQNANGDTFSNGNLEVTTSVSGYGCHTSTFATPLTGKWYAEVTIGNGNALYSEIGLVDSTSTFTNSSIPSPLRGVAYASWEGKYYKDSVSTSYGTAANLANGDVIGIAYDAGAGTVTFYKNGSSLGLISGVTARSYYFAAADYWSSQSAIYIWNFGQRAWTYPANASGFKALCDTNLPAPVVAKPNTVMDVILRTGTGSSGGTVSGLNFSPDLIWEKARNNVSDHFVVDAVRGINSSSPYLRVSSTNAESSSGSWITSTTSTGYTVNSNDYGAVPIVSWCWDAGTSTASNTQGSITSQVRANASAGFSIVTYTGTGANATIGHGLGVAPAMIITKGRTNTAAWLVYHQGIGATNFVQLNTTIASTASITAWNDTAPTSTVFSIGTSAAGNTSGVNNVAYCFAPVSGYSSFGSYTGNGSTDGPFVYTGFRPRWIMFKQSSASGEYWEIYDTARGTYNISAPVLYANDSLQEAPANRLDILSNGFKPRTANAAVNASGSTYVYVAFAEIPFQYARAR